ncbi:uncharacterized mitochondrial protein AtMg00810-like [Malus domestica]|uniref:uncharacterized mitochondrial protein AtMg00810-like n=1 Tax=Malus domestica TaxID=3750 RepID=UPI0039762A04
MVTRSKAGIHKPRVFTATKHHLPSTVDSLTVIPPTLTTYLQASKNSNWLAAMKDEYQALQSTGTWELVPPNPQYNLVGCKCVFKLKHKADGSIESYLKKDVYTVQPHGFIDHTKPYHVCKLKKYLYGLKQAPRAWSSTTVCQSIISKLQFLFPIKDLGDIHYFLGIEVHKSSAGLFLHESKYALDLLKKTDMFGVKPCSTPMGSAKLDHSSSILSNHTFYRSTIGALLYLTWTISDLIFTVNQVCQHMHSPRTIHLQAVRRILRYLKGTIDSGLWFKPGKQCFTAWSDVDWAGCPVDRRSTSGYCVFLGPNLISWSAKKQTTMARSSTEAEYRSLANTAVEITWVCKILQDISFPLLQTPVIYCDNQSSIALAKNSVFHA